MNISLKHIDNLLKLVIVNFLITTNTEGIGFFLQFGNFAESRLIGVGVIVQLWDGQ